MVLRDQAGRFGVVIGYGLVASVFITIAVSWLLGSSDGGVRLACMAFTVGGAVVGTLLIAGMREVTRRR